MARKSVSENPVVVSGSTGAVPARRKNTTKRASRAIATKSAEVEIAPVEVAAVVTAVEPVSEVLASPAQALPSYEEIAALAYSYWEARGYQGGSPEEDWLRAEAELAARK